MTYSLYHSALILLCIFGTLFLIRIVNQPLPPEDLADMPLYFGQSHNAKIRYEQHVAERAACS